MMDHHYYNDRLPSSPNGRTAPRIAGILNYNALCTLNTTNRSHNIAHEVNNYVIAITITFRNVNIILYI